jgi:hypothetical protein
MSPKIMGIFMGFLEITNDPNVIYGRTDNGNILLGF